MWEYLQTCWNPISNNLKKKPIVKNAKNTCGVLKTEGGYFEE